ncbi:adenylate kinase [Pseudarthrobacter sp. N5]|uniref:adenylate kinase n=1 Tax=Pseudarthrobacter sp. N5 TaxID=3418416 RepID=UPI003CFA987E
MTRMLIVGPPGSGKGTQAEVIARHFGIMAISTGEIFRTNVREATPLGAEARNYLDNGDLVPDRLTNAMVRDRLDRADVQSGFLLDGYPRTTAQIAELDSILAATGQQLTAVIQLTADDRELVARMLNRARDQGRSDDTEEVFRRRLRLYRNETQAVVSVYSQRGLVVPVDGSGDPSKVGDRAIAAAEAALAGKTV